MKYMLFILILASSSVLAQKGTQKIREGNNAFEDENYDAAMESYKNALEKNPNLFEGIYNSGNAAYKMDDMEEAATRFNQSVEMASSDEHKHAALHNLGNTFLKQKKFKESIEAYKNALRLDPSAEDTRYNLAYALQKLNEQEQQQGQDQDKDQQKEDNQDENQQDQEKQQDQQKENDQEDKKNEDNQENKEGQEEKNDQQQEQQPQKQEMQNLSREDAERLLNAAKNEDQKVLMRLNQKPQKGEKRNIEKDW